MPLRVNAHFDPITSRTGLAPTAWNSALLPLLADLWVEVVEDLLGERPVAAWDVIPLPEDRLVDDDSPSVVTQMESLLLDRARTELATRAAIVVAGKRVPLTDLAVEDAALEGVIEPTEVARLAGLATPFPAAARDGAGRWRDVLDDWRQAGAPLPKPVTVKDALTLLDDPSRSVDATISLAAVALREGYAEMLAALPCVSTAEGRRVIPPAADSVQSLMVTRSRLAEQLGMGVSLAPEHLAETDVAATVLAWLRAVGAVIEEASNEEVVRRLAAAGRAGQRLARPQTDELPKSTPKPQRG